MVVDGSEDVTATEWLTVCSSGTWINDLQGHVENASRLSDTVVESGLEKMFDFCRAIIESDSQLPQSPMTQAVFVSLFLCGAIWEQRPSPRPVLTPDSPTLIAFIKTWEALFNKMLSSTDEQQKQLFNFIGQLCPLAQAFAAHDRNVLNALHKNIIIQMGVTFARYKDTGVKMLHRLATVMFDEPVLILHPESKQGFRVKISGIADNAQLQGLIDATFVGPDKPLKLGPGLPERCAAVLRGDADGGDDTFVGVYNMVNWPALQPNGAVLPKPKYYLWQEGVPGDMASFRGERVVMLGPNGMCLHGDVIIPIQRSTNVSRVFGPLKASLDVVEVVPEDEVVRIVTAMMTCPPEERQAACDYLNVRTPGNERD